ncbi:MAG: hypothetical protein EA408_10460 [Marinilabiliales bacterium]|nr:MAG: hypothetical protein EA408_10460 [Marinilabiliales bacterium]
MNGCRAGIMNGWRQVSTGLPLIFFKDVFIMAGPISLKNPNELSTPANLEPVKRLNKCGLPFTLLWLAAILSLFPGRLPAQQYSFSHIDMNAGLPSNSIHDIIRDSRGFYWIGTDAGLARWYGNQIKTYGLENGLPGLTVKAVAENKDGNLWLGIQGEGIVAFDGRNFKTVIPYDSLPGNLITRFSYMADRDMLFIGTSNGFATLSNGEYKAYGSLHPDTGTGVIILSFLEAGSFVYVITAANGLYRYYPGRDEPLVHVPFYHGYTRLSHAGITVAGDTIWSPANREVIMRTGPEGTGAYGPLADVMDIAEDQAGNIYLATISTPFSDQGGAYMITGDSLRSLNKMYGLTAESVSRVIYDQSDNLIVISDRRQGLFILFPPVIENGAAGLPPPGDLTVRSFASTDDGAFWILDDQNLWFREPGKGFTMYDKTNLENIYREYLEEEFPSRYSYMLDPEGSYKKYAYLRLSGAYKFRNPYYEIQNGEKLIFPDGAFYSPAEYEYLKARCINPLLGLAPGSDNSLWISTNAGYFRVDETGDIFYFNVRYPGTGNVLVQDDSLLLAAYTSTLYSYRPESPSLPVHVTRIPENVNIASMIVSNGNLLLGCRNHGLILISGNDVSFLSNDNGGLITPVTALSTCSNGNILAGSSNGRIQVLRHEDDTIHILHDISPQGNITGTRIFWIEADGRGYIWAGTNRGINRIRPGIDEQENAVNAGFFGMDHGVLDPAVTSSSVCSNGYIWLGGRGLLARIDTDKAFGLKPSPRDVIIDRIDIDYGETDWHIRGPADNWTGVPAGNLRLKHSSNNLGFHFSTINIGDAQNTLYRYRLTGLNDQWSNFDDNRHVIFPNLRPGKYMLKVEAQLAQNSKSRGTTHFGFRILPPWWQTWWFYTLAGTALLGLFWLILILRIRFVKKHAGLKLNQEREISELRIRALQAQMNPHFTFNAINSIQYYILNKEKDSALLFISYFSKLIRQTMEFASRSSVSIKEEIAFIENYLNLEKMRFEDSFDYKITAGPIKESHKYRIPPMMIQPFVENAVLHGMLHLKKNGFITVVFSATADNLIKCTVEDNGVGRKKSSEINTGNKDKHRSIGLDITSRRLHLMNDPGFNDFRVEIADLHSGEETPAGTRVNIYLPRVTDDATFDEDDWE